MRTRPLTVFELARVLGHYRYVEFALFEIVGEAARVSSSPSLTVVLAEASRAHAYRATQIEERLLVSVGLPHVEDATGAPSPELDALLHGLETVATHQLVSSLVNVWYPAMISSYQEHVSHCGEASDGAVRRLLGRLIYDVDASLHDLLRTGAEKMSSTNDVVERDELRAVGGPFGTRTP
jgi:hypothetical protein